MNYQTTRRLLLILNGSSWLKITNDDQMIMKYYFHL